MFAQMPLKLLADWCHSLAGSLAAGLTLVESLKLTAKRGSRKTQQVSEEILARLEAGDDLAEAFAAGSQRFPPLFVAMVNVAGRTGHLPEVLRELETYFRLQLSLRRKFWSQLSWPILQLVAAVFIIALVLYILGLTTDGANADTFDVVGLGLGAAGAVRWLVLCFGSVFIVVTAVYWVRNVLQKTVFMDTVLLAVPVLGPALKSLALARLAFALKLTLDSDLSPKRAVPLSLSATHNGAFLGIRDAVAADLRRGETIGESLDRHGVFTEEFMTVVNNGEASGTLPESMARLSAELNQRSEFQMSIINKVVGFAIWACVAGFIIFFIFRFFMIYAGMLNAAAEGL